MATVRCDGAVGFDWREMVGWPFAEDRTRAMGRDAMRLPMRPVHGMERDSLHWLRAFVCSEASTVIAVGADGADGVLVSCHDVQRVRHNSVVRIA